jgi:tetraacyldisaccharide 4'-kinase
MRLELQVQEILEGRRPGKGALWFLSLLYRAGAWLKDAAYRSHLITPQKAAAVVVSVGNIVAGGVGKTPLVHLLVQELSKRHKVAILSRGYRSKAERQDTPTLVEPAMTAEDVGDEPLWLARKLPQAQVWVCHDRVASAKQAIQQGAEVIVLDDGFQYRKLHRDFDVVVISGEAPYSNGYFLPRGYLRDLPSRLSDATMLAVMGSQSTNLPGQQVVFERTLTVPLKGKKVALFCAIANPQRFLKQVQEVGAHIAMVLIKPDHDPFFPQELEDLAHQSQADCLVCTEKDFVKLSSLKTSIPLIPIPLELSITQGSEIWHQLINQITSRVQNARISSHAS